MANHASAAKRHRQNIVRKARNRAIRSEMRTALKEAREAIASNADNKQALVKEAISELYRASSKNVLKKRAASRAVARLMRAANKD